MEGGVIVADGLPGRYRHILYNNVKWQDEYGAEGWSREISSKALAEVVSSEIELPGLHTPVLDLDMEAELIPSGTSGHYHLYIDHLMTWREYKRLLKALARAGILEKGYVKASIRRRHSAVRVPWRQKSVT